MPASSPAVLLEFVFREGLEAAFGPERKGGDFKSVIVAYVRTWESLNPINSNQQITILVAFTTDCRIITTISRNSFPKTRI